jgi:hypothetical protein
MSAVCLIPYHRQDKVMAAIESASQDGWAVETMQDKHFSGVCKVREALLSRAFVDKDTEFIRYLDDDDVLPRCKRRVRRRARIRSHY